MTFALDPNGVPPTGVHARIEDAGVLADRGRFEGALLMLLVAVAATARKRYPKMGDHKAFTLFLRDEMWRLVKEHSDIVVFRGKERRIEEFLYKFLRCELVHRAAVPRDLRPLRAEDLLTLDLPNGSRMGFSKLLLARINDVVWRAPENSFVATEREIGAHHEPTPEPGPHPTHETAAPQ